MDIEDVLDGQTVAQALLLGFDRELDPPRHDQPLDLGEEIHVAMVGRARRIGNRRLLHGFSGACA